MGHDNHSNQNKLYLLWYSFTAGADFPFSPHKCSVLSFIHCTRKFSPDYQQLDTKKPKPVYCPMCYSSHIAPVWGQNHQRLRALKITIKLISTICKTVRISSFPLFWTESQKNKVKVALNSRFKITRTEFCKGLVIYSTVQLFNSLFKVLGPGTKYRSPKLWILSLQVILGFVQAVLIFTSTRSPRVSELVHPE